MNPKTFESILNTVREAVNLKQKSIDLLRSFQYPRNISFSANEAPLKLDDPTHFITSNNAKTFNRNALKLNNWHMILIHNVKNFSKQEIIGAFYDIVDDVLFAPVAYRQEKEIAYFLVQNQDDALHKIIDHQMEITLNDTVMQVVIKLSIARYQIGQLKIVDKIMEVLQKRVRSPQKKGVFDLSNLAEADDLKDVYVSFRNAAIFRLFLGFANGIEKLKKDFKVFNFGSNGIRSLEPFSKLYDFKIEVLILYENNIELREFEHLKGISIRELMVYKNPCTEIFKYHEKIHEMLPGLHKVDTNAFEHEIDIFMDGNDNIADIGEGTIVEAKDLKAYRNKIENLYSDSHWTQVIIYHQKRYSTQDIMDELAMNIVGNVPFYPCYLKRINNRDEFFLYRNSDAVKLLVQANLKITIPPSRSAELNIKLKLHVARFKNGQVYWYNKLMKALTSRLIKNELNLNSFQYDREFEKMFVPMNSRTTMQFLLEQAKKQNSNISKIDAEHNGLKKIDFFLNFNKLTNLNLSNNFIADLSAFVVCLSVTDLKMNNNPICNNKGIIDYVKEVMLKFPSLVNLDGHRIEREFKNVYFQNFLVQRELYNVVDEFIKYFFHTWDSLQRKNLLPTYHNSAIFSMSFKYELEKSALPFNQVYPLIQKYITASRNLHSISNFNAVAENVFIGNDIEKAFNCFPRTVHYLQSFTVDVPYFDEKTNTIMLTVGGIFEELFSGSTVPFLLNFSRTFIIRSKNSEFRILNDQLLLRSPTTEQRDMIMALPNVADEKKIDELCADLKMTMEENHEMKIIMLQQLTELKEDYCEKLLRESSWDLKATLAHFNTALQNNQIPDDKFQF